MPAGFLFLLSVTPFSKEVVKGSEEGDGAVEVVVLSSMDEDFVWDLVAIWWCRRSETNQSLAVQALKFFLV